MSKQTNKKIQTSLSLIFILISFFLPYKVASDPQRIPAGNFGLPGIIDLPTALRFPDGELIITQQLHKSLARSGISFQALPRVGVSFRYTGHGINQEKPTVALIMTGVSAHISIIDEASCFSCRSGLRFYWHRVVFLRIYPRHEINRKS